MISLTDKDLVRILRKFADDPDDVLIDRQTIICRINGEDISVEWDEDEDGILYCKEPHAARLKARLWIEKRLARLDVLASKIQQYITKDDHFIPVPSHFESVSIDKEEPATTESLFELLKERNPCATEAIYLLSEAGEGKTMIMDRLASIVAQQYKEQKVHFLFLPVSLQGRPFLRIDDLVIGILANKFRFRGYYFEAIIELMRLGLIILGLDGFEEMVVEGKEDNVISSLGELLSQMNSNGKIVISARRAFYDYALKNQAPLVEAIRDLQVDFSSYRLSSWSQKEFCNLLDSFDFNKKESDSIYQALALRLGKDHPILIRPVLARKLVEMCHDNKDKWKDIVEQFDEDKNPQAVVDNFVFLLLKREASQKWLLHGKQLLRTDQHFELLQNLAEEMWLSNVEYVKQDYLQTWIEIFCEQQKISPAEAKDCKEKIIHHAMLIKEGDHYLFCHEAFRQYFLGRQIASYIKSGKYDFHLRRILSQDILTTPTIDSMTFSLSKDNASFESLVDQLYALKGGESKVSPISQNIAGILISCWKKGDHSQCYTFEKLYFAESMLAACSLTNLSFVDCVIEKIDASQQNSINNVSFQNCSITNLVLSSYKNATIDCTFDALSIPGHVFICELEQDFFSPDQIKAAIISAGAKLQDDTLSTNQPAQPDEELAVFEKIVRKFYRTSGVTGSMLSMIFADKWSTYEQDYLQDYLDNGLLKNTDWRGHGSDVRYKLGISIDNYEYAIKNCNGSFSKFLSLCSKKD